MLQHTFSFGGGTLSITLIVIENEISIQSSNLEPGCFLGGGGGGWLVDFYGISTLVSYLMPNPVHVYISNI